VTAHPTVHCSEVPWSQHPVCKYPKRRNGFLEMRCSFWGLDQRRFTSADTIELERWHRRYAHTLPQTKSHDCEAQRERELQRSAIPEHQYEFAERLCCWRKRFAFWRVGNVLSQVSLRTEYGSAASGANREQQPCSTACMRDIPTRIAKDDAGARSTLRFPLRYPTQRHPGAPTVTYRGPDLP